MYKVELSSEAQRFYDRCDKSIARKLARCFEALEGGPPTGNNVKPLKGKLAGSFRTASATFVLFTRFTIKP